MTKQVKKISTSGRRSRKSFSIDGVTDGVISTDRLAAVMQELLATAHAARALHSCILDRSSDSETHSWIRYFQSQTVAEIESLEAALRDLGARPDTAIDGAEVQQQRLQSRLSLEVPSPLQEAVDMENLTLTLLQSELLWDFLEGLQDCIDDPEARTLCARLLEEIRPEQLKQAEWARSSLMRLRFRELVQVSHQSLAA